MSFEVRVSAPSRIHFGLLRFAQQEGASYGGLGMMIDQPRTAIELQLASEWQAEGPMADRALTFAKLASSSHSVMNFPAIHVRVCEAPLAHSGLGTGTQLALAIARGVRELSDLPPLDATGLAKSVERGERSAVGSHGFQQGGLIWEVGRQPCESLGALAHRLHVPDEWRILLFALPQRPGLHGEPEAEAFDRLPPMPSNISNELCRLVEESILPAVKHSDFDAFAEAVHDYGRLSGSCFTSVQGGSFASPAIAFFVDQLRSEGIRGVGQSSWGPTVFAFAPNEAKANEFVERALKTDPNRKVDVTIVAPDNHGAVVKRTESDQGARYV